ncbi:trichoplein keratin filament-binding protein [Phlebotomus argentipes]|uniref:trichoplein keratin filament-binding protein n=1 Tax=Phlebotomus argentipes TaxID=94469 RepID=UPI002892FEA9|nr:trichoplein keratin filament-binding protein [Phlebotomus argentipes]
MSTQILLKKWARQREKQEQKIEKSLAAKDFFDKNRNLTSHFDSWTTPQFYQRSSDQIEQSKASQRREEELEERRQRLRDLRLNEEQQWHQELREGHRTRSRPSTKCLTDINNHLSESVLEEKRKCDLESQLYSRWRSDATRDKIIHESRSTHEALAKLSWLDKQVEQKIEREKKEKEAAEREKRIQEETERQEKLLSENRHVLDSQIREVRSIQESNMHQMRRNETECRDVKLEAEKVHQSRQKIEDLFQKWKNCSENRAKNASKDIHNPRRIKMLIDMRISCVRQAIEEDLDFLQNLLAIVDEEKLKPLVGKFRQHLEDTSRESDRVRSLYDSEAKAFLVNREVLWSAQIETRDRLIRHNVTELLSRLTLEREKALARSQELNGIRATHLRAIEDSNEMLRTLTRNKNDQTLPRMDLHSDSASVVTDEIADRTSRRQADECDSIVNQLSSQRITPEAEPSGSGPRFARKKVAWI